jgi:hypothetical protein
MESQSVGYGVAGVISWITSSQLTNATGNATDVAYSGLRLWMNPWADRMIAPAHLRFAKCSDRPDRERRGFQAMEEKLGDFSWKTVLTWLRKLRSRATIEFFCVGVKRGRRKEHY